MAITTSAKKAIRVSVRRRVLNETRKRAMRQAVKEVRRVTSGESDTKTLLQQAYVSIDKAAKRGVIKKNTANRKKSRLAKALNKLSNLK